MVSPLVTVFLPGDTSQTAVQEVVTEAEYSNITELRR